MDGLAAFRWASETCEIMFAVVSIWMQTVPDVAHSINLCRAHVC